MPDVITIFDIPIALDGRLLFLLIVVYIAGIIRGLIGFGSALLVVPMLALLFGPAQAVVIEVILEIPTALGLLAPAIREASRKTVLPMLTMFVFFVPVGAYLLKTMDPEPLRIGISLAVLGMVLTLVFQKRIAGFLTPIGVMLTGAVAGVMQGLTGIAGPLFATALLARGENPETTRANIIAVAAGIIAVSVISFWALGLLTVEAAIYAGLATPSILLGVWTGSYLFRRFKGWNFRGIILVFLAMSSIATLAQSFS